MRAVRALVLLALSPATLLGQTPKEQSGSTPASSYEQRYEEVLGLEPRSDGVARVSNLVLTRDVARFTLRSGELYRLSAVGGRTVGVAFRGEGTFSFSPPTKIEQDRLARFENTRSLDAPFTELVLLFADTTLAELERRLTFGEGTMPGDLHATVNSSLEFLGDLDHKTLDPDLMAAFLNGDSSGLFYAHINRRGSGPLMFMVNPFETEGVTLGKRPPRTAWTNQPEVICRFPRQGTPPAAAITGDRAGAATIRDYRMTITLAQTGGGDLSFVAAARVDIAAEAPVGPWVVFHLFSKLRVDSARWEDGTPATVFRGKDAEQLWIRLDRRFQVGETRPLLLHYHGDLIDRFGDFFFIKSSIAWYPVALEGRSYATFDITYHSPSHYLIASVGDRKDAAVAGRILTTRWVTPEPIRNASFNLGLFEEYRVQEEGTPPVTVLVSEQAHRQLAQSLRREGVILSQQRKMKETVGTDVLQSLKFFQQVYGTAPVTEFYATEIPYVHGEAFPGLVNLSWATFQQTDQQGEDEVFRAHEVAHQWWGIAVDFATYHDQWLSEGFSDFSGLWYLHAARRESDKYFGILRRWRANIFDKRGEPSPIGLGYRASSSKDEGGYQILVYQKGAWVLHMLRILMLELRTAKEDRFTAMMQDFYRTHRGRRASTADFQRVVETHIGTGMDWFFQQWVYGTEIPTYRVAWKADAVENGQYRVTLRVAQENVGDGFQMYVPVTVDLGDNRQGRYRVNVRGPQTEIALPLLPAEPKGLKFNDLEGVLCEVKMVAW
ncbi:MAG: M1 family metallopeptidase [Gemmatimonadales bacterium]